MKLAANVCYAKGTGKAKVVTVGVLKFGDLTLGSLKMVGRASEEQVLREVRLRAGRGFVGITLTAQGQETLPVLVK